MKSPQCPANFLAVHARMGFAGGGNGQRASMPFAPVVRREPDARMSDPVVSNVRQLRRPVGRNGFLHRRRPTKWLAQLHTAADESPCIVEDFSASGARLRVALAVAVGEAVTLTVGTAAPINARIAWRRGERLGLDFGGIQLPVAGLLMRAARAARTRSRDQSA
jgi:hypothetical protein